MSHTTILAILAALTVAGCGAPSVDPGASLVGDWLCERPRDDVGEYRAVERFSDDGLAHLT